MQIFDRYIFKNLFIATLFTALVLAGIILLTQSLQFLELIMSAGATGRAFWMLAAMALPRFFEIILPIALMASTVFIYNRMAMDSELTAMRATGYMSPLRLARPALMLATLVTMLLIFVTAWLAPVSQRGMNQMRVVMKAQYSTLLFREGVFNSVRPGLTVFVRSRGADGGLYGVIIHDSRPENKSPVTVLAKRGVVVTTPDGQQVLVYEGSRQSVNPETRALERLDFERYTIDLPEGSGPVRERWREPDERTFFELFHPDPLNIRDADSHAEFMAEAQRRLVGPFLALTYTVLVLVFLLLGPVDRRGQGMRIALSVGAIVLLQGLYLAAVSLSKQSPWGLLLLYAVVVVPLGGGLFLLSEWSALLRRSLFWGVRRKGFGT